ncbi:hypothetical protein L873DRAFT_1822085 [Choiromyces venosus 120613-1]|uniref:Uncharacterized protein n=1 Tax=Choiromyces venosus 120613-1 TaxID=1336337 RepID=A0A3N4IY10_9PEZI|nr:hypothetical protein L873DRAFT_1822085 [Choiromyces venosus 120613-1]
MVSCKYHTQSSTIQNGNLKPELIDADHVNLTSKAQRVDGSFALNFAFLTQEET